MSINFTLVNEIQEKADIVNVISQFIKLQRKGKNYFGLCPFHQDNNPSLVVSPQKKIFKCFVCNTKGNVFSFVQKFKNISFLEAVKMVGEIIGYDTDQLNKIASNSFIDEENKRLTNLNALAGEWYHGFLYNKENKKYLDYLYKRGITDELIKQYLIGYAPNQTDLIYRMLTNHNNMFGSNRDKSLIYTKNELLNAGIAIIDREGHTRDFFNNRITFPIYDNNNYIVGFTARSIEQNEQIKYLNTSTTKIFSKSNVLFNFHKVKDLNTKKLIIVEGPMDAFAYIKAGHTNVVATLGTAFSEKTINLLRSLTQLDTIILSFDNDLPGQNANREIGLKLMENSFNVFVVGDYDYKYKDVDELYSHNGKQAIDDIIANRTDFISFLIKKAFTHKLPIDEQQKQIKEIIHTMVYCGNDTIMFLTKHLELLAQYTNLNIKDLQKFYDITYEKENGRKHSYKKNVLQENNTFGINKHFIETTDTLKNEHNKSRSGSSEVIDHINNQLKNIEYRLTKTYELLLFRALTHPEYIDKIFNEIYGDNDFSFKEINLIIKSIQYLYDDNKFDIDNLLKHINEKSNSGNNLANDYLKAKEFLQNFLKEENFSLKSTMHKTINLESIHTNINKIHELSYEKQDILLRKRILDLYTKTNTTRDDEIQMLIKKRNDLKKRWKEFTNNKVQKLKN